MIGLDGSRSRDGVVKRKRHGILTTVTCVKIQPLPCNQHDGFYFHRLAAIYSLFFSSRRIPNQGNKMLVKLNICQDMYTRRYYIKEYIGEAKMVFHPTSHTFKLPTAHEVLSRSFRKSRRRSHRRGRRQGQRARWRCSRCHQQERKERGWRWKRWSWQQAWWRWRQSR